MGTNIPDPPQDSLAFLRMIMLNMDPPKHTKYRRLVSKGFTPKIVVAIEPHVRKIANEIIDRVAERSESDFVNDIAAELPLQVILATGTLASFGWLLVQDQIHPLFVYFLQIYLTF